MTGGQDFAAYLRVTMRARGETPSSLAEKHPDLNKSTISRWQNGDTEAPTPEKLRLLADLLHVPYLDLMMAAGYILPSDIGRANTPAPPEPMKHDILRAIREDDTLSDEAKRHFRNQYKLLQRVMPAHGDDQRRRATDADFADVRAEEKAKARARLRSRHEKRNTDEPRENGS